MSEAEEKVKNFIGNITQFVTLSEPQTYKNLTIIPLILKDDLLDFITIKEAEEAEIGYIQEMESEQVANLQAVNQGTTPILIPYMQVVKGGKQDRTIYEPILVAGGTTIAIPSKCIERSRWTYQSAYDSGTKRFHTSAQKMNYSLHAKTIRASYSMKSAQSEMWDGIEQMSSRMGLAAASAPTRSGITIQETQKQNIDDYLPHFQLAANQAGIIGLVNNQVIALELYGNPIALKIFWKDIMNSFVMEAILRAPDAKDIPPLKREEIHEKALQSFENYAMQYKVRNGVSLGTIIEFADPNLIWAGIALVHENKFAHFYVVGKSVFPEEQIQVRQMQATRLQRQINRAEQRID
ncbi:MAG TPA: DUF6569 family protein [Candidatus Deferrimicrobium sp.]|nr:DUF6569 family protein [Candidatus Deferrimicrobium sp.]